MGIFLLAFAVCDRSTAAKVSPEAPLFEKMGSHQRKITTDNPKAQDYFNQGLIWMYAFNHDEAIRSFTSAAQIDDNCAMAWWGISLAAGPQYNHPVMNEERTATAWWAMQKALVDAGHDCTANLVHEPMMLVECGDEDLEKNLKVLDRLEEVDDVDAGRLA